MIIQHNMAAMNTNRQLGISQGALSKSTEKLSSGYRINRAGDDAAGLAISEKMRSQIRGLDRASANSQDGISLIQTAEGALNESQNILQRMRELAVQAANGTNTDSDREEIQKEINQLTSEVNRIANTTEFNTMKLLKGSSGNEEVNSVDSTLVAAGGGKGGEIGNFTIDKKSTHGNQSVAQLIGNTGKATGKVSNMSNPTVAVKEQAATASIGGITFQVSGTSNITDIEFVTIDEKGDEGLVQGKLDGADKSKAGANTLTIALKKSTIDKFLHTGDLINKINSFTSADKAKFGSGTTAATAGKSLSELSLKIVTPFDQATGIPVDISTTVGDTKQSTKFNTAVPETVGKYEFTLEKEIKEAGDTITLFGQTFTAVDSRTGAIVHADQGEFDIAKNGKLGTAAEQADSLLLAIKANATLKEIIDDTSTTAVTGKITITEKAKHAGELADFGTSVKTEGSGGADDTLDIINPDGTNGIIYKLASGAGALNVSFDNKHTVTITLAKNASENTAEKIQEQIRLLGKKSTDLPEDPTDPDTANRPLLNVDFSNVITKAGGNWNTATVGSTNLENKKAGGVTGGGLQDVKGQYTFTLTSAFNEGDRTTILGKTFIAKEGGNALKGEINVSSKNMSDQASALRSALMQDKDISSKYDVSVNSNRITFTEKEISGKNLNAKDISVKAAAGGKYKVELNEVLKNGSALMIDGVKIDVSSKKVNSNYDYGKAIKETDTLSTQAQAFAEAINKNSDMSCSASVDEDGNLIITQSEVSAKGPQVSITGAEQGTFDVTFQVGANTGQSMTIAIDDNRSLALGIAGDGSSKTKVAENGATAYYTEAKVVTDGTTNDNIEYALDITSYEKATAAIGVIDDALAAISAQRSQLGAYQNRLEHTIANLDNTSENLQSAESRIRDVDMAEEMTKYSKNNILQQAAQSMLAQANQSTQGVLTLLR